MIEKVLVNGRIMVVPDKAVRARESAKAQKAEISTRDIMERLDVICEALNIYFGEEELKPM